MDNKEGEFFHKTMLYINSKLWRIFSLGGHQKLGVSFPGAGKNFLSSNAMKFVATFQKVHQNYKNF